MLKSYFQARFYDPRMSYLRTTPRYRSRSFVQGFLKMIYLAVSENDATLSYTDIHGVGQSQGSSNTGWAQTLDCTAPGRGGAGMIAAVGSATAGVGETEWSSSTNNGIVVGTGTTAVAPTDYQLATPVIDGVTSGTLEHFPCGGTTVVSAAPTASFTLERLFRNSSGGSITINEVGVYATSSESTFGDLDHVCLIRDIVSPGFAVLNGEYMRIIYTISVTA